MSIILTLCTILGLSIIVFHFVRFLGLFIIWLLSLFNIQVSYATFLEYFWIIVVALVILLQYWRYSKEAQKIKGGE